MRWGFQFFEYYVAMPFQYYFDLLPWWLPDSEIFFSVLRIRIRIHMIHMFLGLPNPDPLVRGMDPDPDPALDPDPSNIMQK